MAILMNIEQGTARKGNLDKQITKVKGYMEKALDKFLKFKLTEAERMAFLQLKKDLEAAYSSAQLMLIVENGLELTQRFKED
jgi:hypothetical protein